MSSVGNCNQGDPGWDRESTEPACPRGFRTKLEKKAGALERLRKFIRGETEDPDRPGPATRPGQEAT